MVHHFTAGMQSCLQNQHIGGWQFNNNEDVKTAVCERL